MRFYFLRAFFKESRTKKNCENSFKKMHDNKNNKILIDDAFSIQQKSPKYNSGLSAFL
jgi:uncharacterized protein YpiB (UPF0302 family)